MVSCGQILEFLLNYIQPRYPENLITDGIPHLHRNYDSSYPDIVRQSEVLMPMAVCKFKVDRFSRWLRRSISLPTKEIDGRGLTLLPLIWMLTQAAAADRIPLKGKIQVGYDENLGLVDLLNVVGI
jgi:hypothetical protein